MAVGEPDATRIRAKLVKAGNPGNPYVMGLVISSYGVNYTFDDNASLSEAREWLKDGEFLITHGWFTRSGHVICLDGLEVDPSNLSYRFNVKDPWSEFNAKAWAYNLGSLFYDGYYSSRLVYATCVKSANVREAAAIYRRGELDSMRKGMWVHRIKP